MKITKISVTNQIWFIYMNYGNWNNIQIVDSDWVQQSVCPQVFISGNAKTVSDDGYGFLLWTYILRDSNVPLEITEANGNGGQIIFMCKRLHVLIVFTGGNYNRRDIVNNYFTAIKDYILPAIKKRVSNEYQVMSF
jgi:hypothetical protein